MQNPTDKQLSDWTLEASEYMSEGGRKVFPFEIQNELFTRGARRCNKCKQVKLLDKFAKDSHSRHRLQSACKTCKSEYTSQWVKDNPERFKAATARCREAKPELYRATEAAYRETHRDRIAERSREYRAENRDTIREKRRQYRLDNYDKVLEQNRRWREANPTYGRDQYAANPWEAALRFGFGKADNRGLPAEKITQAELLSWWESQGIDPGRCIYTGVELVHLENRSLDHKVPLSEPDSPGHVLENLVPADLSVNVRKNRQNAVQYVINRKEGN